MKKIAMVHNDVVANKCKREQGYDSVTSYQETVMFAEYSRLI